MRRAIIGVLLFCVIIPVVSHGQETGKNFIKGLKGTDSLSIGRVAVGSMFAPGYGQAYNKQYWKLPVMYGAGAALIYGGANSHSKYKKTGTEKYMNQSRLYYAGAGLVYLGSIIDGLTNYKTQPGLINPAKSTLFACFLPGLGQAYNQDYWKLPIVYGGFVFMGYWWDLNSMQYKRYRTGYNMEYAYSNGLSETPSEFNKRLSLSGIKSRRDHFRRQRDYAVLYIALWYAVTIVDATVFAQLSNFDVGEDLALKVAPAIIPNMYASGAMPALGISMSITLK